MAMIGITELERALRHPVEAQQQPFGLELQRCQLARKIARKRVDVERIVVIRRQRPHRGLHTDCGQRGEDSVIRGRRRAAEYCG